MTMIRWRLHSLALDLDSGGSSTASMISPIRRACCGHLLAFVSRIVLPSNRFGATQCAASAVNQFRSLPFLAYDRRLARRGCRHAVTVPNASTPHPQPDLTSRSTTLAQRPSGPASMPAPPSDRRADAEGRRQPPVGPSRARIRRLAHPDVDTPTAGPPARIHSLWSPSTGCIGAMNRRALDARRPREPSSGHRSASRRRSPANTPLEFRDRLRPRAIGGVVIAHCPSPALQDGPRSCGA